MTAMAFAGDMTFDPVKETLTAADGTKVQFEPPRGEELPAKGFAKGEEGFVAPAENGDNLTVDLPPTSERLQLLQPFPKWDGKDFFEAPDSGQGEGKVHHRSYLSGRSLAEVPGASR
ncbi:MAG: hypothetical protein MPW14_23150 [Candidatus Manganitrophus sp.]|nr:MAG: hypothetical protein MPW14_23150 [Candidatus Manganitrophus sp.]